MASGRSQPALGGLGLNTWGGETGQGNAGGRRTPDDSAARQRAPGLLGLDQAQPSCSSHLNMAESKNGLDASQTAVSGTDLAAEICEPEDSVKVMAKLREAGGEQTRAAGSEQAGRRLRKAHTA